MMITAMPEDQHDLLVALVHERVVRPALLEHPVDVQTGP